MDPNATLAEMRDAIEMANMHEDHGFHGLAAEMRATAAEHAAALDAWLSGGGFLPDAWKR